MSNTSLLGAYGGLDNSSILFRNVLVNGCLRVWQRGTSQTTDGYGSDDRWISGNSGSTKTHSQQTFTLGQTDVPGNPQFFSRTVVSSVAGANNFVAKYQRIESVRTLAGQTATLSFWAKADASKNIAVEFSQSFGSGGSPSAGILSIGVTTIALTSSWRYYTVTVNIPSISGKTVGTTDDGWLQLLFWFDAGSSFNSRTNSLGQQSGTFDIAQVQLEAGPTATPFERRPYGVELGMAMRYYEKTPSIVTTPALTSIPTAGRICFVPFLVAKRVTPQTITVTSNAGTANVFTNLDGYTDAAAGSASVTGEKSIYGFTIQNSSAGALSSSNNRGFGFLWSADAEL
jgi:hypothetical protein